MIEFYPEGILIEKPENAGYFKSINALNEAFFEEKILEARAVICDAEHNLIVDMGCIKGIIPREEGALGIKEGRVRDIAIISRVNRPVSFVITDFKKNTDGATVAILSRSKAQQRCMQQYIASLSSGDVINARITHLEPFGAFADVGCGIVSLIPIDTISVSRIDHPRERFSVGMDIRAVVKSIENGRISLTHKELLGTWQENASNFSVGETVAGIIRTVEQYGAFVELTPNIAGLAEIKDGIVEIMGIAREAGSRTKMAVRAKVPNVDPVGACVGVNGARVKAIVNELGNEQIDIIEWDENPAQLIVNALSPAKVVSATADDEEKKAEIIVSEQQLSLAIGKSGQNVRLAAKLTGFGIDIKSEAQANEDIDETAGDEEDVELTLSEEE